MAQRAQSAANAAPFDSRQLSREFSATRVDFYGTEGHFRIVKATIHDILYGEGLDEIMKRSGEPTARLYENVKPTFSWIHLPVNYVRLLFQLQGCRQEY